jgi:hypothetical protein
MTPESMDLKALFDLWMDSPLKVQVVAFYHRNPGMIETVEGLAQRMGSDEGAMRKAVADHVRIGFLRQRKLGSTQVLMFDRQGEARLQAYVAKTMDAKGRRTGS